MFAIVISPSYSKIVLIRTFY